MTSRNLLNQLRRGLDRASFEADRKLRQDKARAEAARLAQQAHERRAALAAKLLELYRLNALPPPLAALAQEVATLEAQVQAKLQEADAILKEEWADDSSSQTPVPPVAGAQAGPAVGPPRAVVSAVPAPGAPRLPHHYCGECGVPIYTPMTFCPHCGARQDEA